MDHRVSETFTDLTRPKRPVSQSYSQAPLSPVKKKVSKKNPAELKFCASVLRELMNKKHTALNYPFLTPVDAIALGIPQYLQIIQNPMDLSKIKRKLDHGEYNDGEDFEEDVRLMFNNCYTFNRPEDDVYQLGKKLESIFDEKWASKPTMPILGSHKSRGDDSSDEGT
jgi:bromodomain-containing factor 1